MSEGNPWQELTNAEYERHMGHPNVGQLQALSTITRDQLALVRHLPSPAVVVLGIANGNGLEHCEPSHYRSVIGIDISFQLLEVCRERFADLGSALQLYQLDLMNDAERAVAILSDADLVIANLVVEHIYLENFQNIVRDLNGPIVSVTVQLNPDGVRVSRSGYERAFDGIVRSSEECDESALARSMECSGFSSFGRVEYPLPNGKVLVRTDFRRQGRQMALGGLGSSSIS